MTREQKGLILLGIGNAFAIWSAFNPSFFTVRKFAQREGTEQDREDLKTGYALALGAVAVMGFGIYYVGWRTK